MTISPDKPIDGAYDNDSQSEKKPEKNSSNKKTSDNDAPEKIDAAQGDAPKKGDQSERIPPKPSGNDNASDEGKTPASGKKPSAAPPELARLLGTSEGKPAEPPASGKSAAPPDQGKSAAPPDAGKSAAPPDAGKSAAPPDAGKSAEPPASGKSAEPPESGKSAEPPASGKSAEPPASGKSAAPPASGKEPTEPSASGKVPDSAEPPAKDDPYNYLAIDPEGWPVPSKADDPAAVGLVKVEDLDKPIPGMPKENDLYVNHKTGDVYKKTAFGTWDHIGTMDETGQYKPDAPVTNPQKYPDQDPEGFAVPPPGGNPAYYGLTKTNDIPNHPDAYFNEKTGDLYSKNADGSYDHIGLFHPPSKKYYPDTKGPTTVDVPVPTTAKAPAEQYTTGDKEGYPVPASGTRPGDANLVSSVDISTPISGLNASPNTFVNMETGDVYVRNSDTNTYDHIGKVIVKDGKPVFIPDNGPADAPKGNSPDLPETSQQGFPVPKKGSTPAENNLKPISEMVNPPPNLPQDQNLYVASDGKVFQLQDDGSWERMGKVDTKNNTYNPFNRGNTGVPFGHSPALPEKDKNGHGVPKKDSTPEQNNVKLITDLVPPPYNMPSGSDLDGLYVASDGKVYKWSEDGRWTRVGKINLLTNNYDKNENR